MEKKNKIIKFSIFLVILLFLLIIGSGNVVSPFFGEINMLDEGQYGAWFMHMINGGHLYKDTYAAYGPFYIYPFYLVSKIFGPSFFLVRVIYGVIGTFISVLIVGAIFQKFKIRNLLQIFGFALLLIIPGFGLRQGIALLAILISVTAMEKKSFKWRFLAGSVLASSFLVSSDMGIFASFTCFLLFMITFINEQKRQLFFKKLLFYFSGLFFILISFFVWTYSEEWFFAYISSILDDLHAYSGINIPIGRGFPNAISLIPHSISIVLWVKYFFSKELLLYWLFLFYIFSFIYFFIKTILKKTQKNDILLFLITVYGFLLSTILIGRFGSFPFTLSPVFILFAYFLDLFLKKYNSLKLKSDKFTIIFISLVILLFSLRLISIYRPHFSKIPQLPKYILMNKNTPSYTGNIYIPRDQDKSTRLIQYFVAQNTKVNEKIFFFSNEPAMYLFVNRVSPTRFDLPETANTREKRLEIIKAFENDKTRYIIEDRLSYSVDGINNRVRLPEVYEYIKKNYDSKNLGQFVIYKRK